MEERDLSFAPVRSVAPQKLSAEQIDFYNAHGYVKPIRIFDEAETRAVRAYFDSLLAHLMSLKDGRDSYAINGYHVCCRGLWDIVTHPRILDYVQDIAGPNFVGWGTHFFCKMPHDPKVVPWHQDASYWPLSPARTVTVWLAIDDADAENAAMQFLPGTHKMGALQWRPTQRNAALGQEIVDAEALGEPVFDDLRAGEMSLHADMLAHGSTANTSGRRRCGLTIRYCSTDVRCLDEAWAKQAILCRGEDTSGHWSKIPRPPGENLAPDMKPVSIGGN